MVNVREFGERPAGLVALHGFTQHGGAFEELAAHLDMGLSAVDLPGHGLTEVEPVTFEVAVEVVGEVVGSSRPTVLGYSQGGRVALGLALRHPELIDRLVLVSASPGIADSALREERRRSDEALADRLESIGVPAFLEEWSLAEMFGGLRRRSKQWQEADRGRRLENTAAALAAALRGMGQGTQAYLGERLVDLTIPVLLIAGADDAGYRGVAGRMVQALPEGRLEVVAGAGHNVIGEQPERVAALVRAFMAAPTG